MNAYQLYRKHQDFTCEPLNVWVCGKCGVLFGETTVNFYRGETPQECATLCCTPKTCSKCGTDMPTRDSGYTYCRDCRHEEERIKELQVFTRAEKLTPDQYDGPVCSGYDDYHADLDAYLEDAELSDEGPAEYVYACDVKTVHINPTYAINNILETMLEDVDDADSLHIKGLDELRVAIQQFNDVQTMTTWWRDNTRVVLIPEEMRIHES